MENTSGLEAAGHAVLVKPYDPAVKSEIIEIPRNVRDNMMIAEQRAVVIQIGSEAWKEEAIPRATPGDKVLVTKYAGFSAIGPLDGKEYRLVNDRDIFCRITGERENG